MKGARIAVAMVALGALAIPGIAAAAIAPAGANPATDVRSAPPSLSGTTRAVVPEDFDATTAATARTPGLLVRDVVRSAGQPPGLFPEGATEPSVAIDPRNPQHIAITSFYDFWFDSKSSAGRNASLFYSIDGGHSWTRRDTIPPGPGVVSLRRTFGPCDQAIDYGNHHQLAGTFLVCTRTGTYVITGSTSDPTRTSAWSWCADGGPSCPARPGPHSSMDQPQLLVNRDPVHAGRDDTYVAYDNFFGLPGRQFASTSHVGVANGDPLRFSRDAVAGIAQPLATNPGLRLGKDPRTGTMYALYERSATTGAKAKKIVTYMLNRSTDAGRTWSLNGHRNGIPIATTLSEQAPYYKFCGVNALLGGVDALNVDPGNGDVYVAYGNDRAGGYGNEIFFKRLTTNAAGMMTVPAATSQVTAAGESALPSVAVTRSGKVGVLYDTCEGTTASGLPRFTARLARSNDRGRTFSGMVLSRFLSSQKPNDKDSRQRVLGDYQQLKSVGNVLYGVFSGNRASFGGNVSTTDPIFFRQS